ncbi:hypothetical protein V6N13_091954 [Hibiscus sabdariffa]|uniref:Uncharacterized protein n=1 Tax=Hibiscus sabdariffa TaxID=183260 RepID=A0ABR2QFJ2_9ROSI
MLRKVRDIRPATVSGSREQDQHPSVITPLLERKPAADSIGMAEECLEGKTRRFPTERGFAGKTNCLVFNGGKEMVGRGSSQHIL